MSWSLPLSLHQPPAAPTTTLRRQPTTGCINQLSRGHLGLFTWLQWMHGGRVNTAHHNSSLTNMCSALKLLLVPVWVSSTICTFYPSQLHRRENCDGQTCWRFLPLVSFNFLKFCNLRAHHQLVIVLPISVLLFNFARIIHSTNPFLIQWFTVVVDLDFQGTTVKHFPAALFRAWNKNDHTVYSGALNHCM